MPTAWVARHVGSEFAETLELSPWRPVLLIPAVLFWEVAAWCGAPEHLFLAVGSTAFLTLVIGAPAAQLAAREGQAGVLWARRLVQASGWVSAYVFVLEAGLVQALPTHDRPDALVPATYIASWVVSPCLAMAFVALYFLPARRPGQDHGRWVGLVGLALLPVVRAWLMAALH